MAEMPTTGSDLTQAIADLLAGHKLRDGAEALILSLAALVAIASENHGDAARMINEIKDDLRRHCFKHWDWFREQAAANPGRPGHG